MGVSEPGVHRVGKDFLYLDVNGTWNLWEDLSV